MKRVWTLVAAATFLIGAAPLGAAPAARVLADGAVLSVSVVPATGRAQVVIGVDGDVTVQDFTLRNPDKIVVDVTGATLGLPRGDNYDRVARGGILNVRYSQFKRNVVRIVIDLDAPRHYTVQQVNGEIRISLDGSATQFVAWTAGDKPLARASVSVRTPDSATDVQPAGEPVAAPAPVSASPADAKFESIERPTGSRFASAAQPQQPRITISWQNADITDVLAAFAAFSGRTIIPGKDVKGTITAEIVNQPWDVAMRALLNANGFDAREDDHGIIIVDTYENIASRRTEEPLSTRTIRLNYVKAAQVQPLLEPRLSRDCSALNSGTTRGAAVATQGGPTGQMACPPRGAVIADSLTNSISVTDIPSQLDALEQYARSIDIRQPQVNIKAKIIIVDRTQLEALGLRYDLAAPHNYYNTQQLLQTHGDSNSKLGPSVVLGGNLLAAVANAEAPVASPALRLLYSTALGNYALTTFLEALQQTSLSDIQAEPSATVLNNHLADLSSGSDIPLRTIDLSAGGSGGGGSGGGSQQQAFPRATVTQKRVGIRLQVTPTVTNNRQVQMTLHVEESTAIQQGVDAYEFPIRSVDNVVLVGDGETAVMGGLTRTDLTVSRTGIPILVDLPLIGRLFGVNSRTERKEDLLILVTPHIIDDGQAPAPQR